MLKYTANWSKAQIEKGIPFEVGPRDWLISISDSAASIRPANKFARVLFTEFHDADREADGILITERQARQIADFIRDAEKANANVWVNCHAGMCRSGAVVEVLAALGWEVADEFSPERIPNVLVFDMVRKQFPELLHSWEIHR